MVGFYQDYVPVHFSDTKIETVLSFQGKLVINAAPEEDSPEKRVEKLFALMDKVSFQTYICNFTRIFLMKMHCFDLDPFNKHY